MLTLQIFQQTRFWFLSEKHLHCTISRRPRTSFWKYLENECQYIPVYLRKFFFREAQEAFVWCGRWGGGGGAG